MVNKTNSGEVFQSLYSLQDASVAAARLCMSYFLIGWIRAEVDTSLQLEDAPLPEYNYSMLVCHQTIEAYNFDVTVSPQGQILSSTRLSDVIASSALPASPTALQTLNIHLVNVPVQALRDTSENAHEQHLQNELILHGDTKPKDWFSYITAGFTNDSSFLDPKLPAPSALFMVDSVSKTWSLLKVLLLSKICSTNSVL